MGSIIAALFANGYTSSEMEQLVEKVRLLNLVDPILKN
jgi:predicted acylesterase/phospholipase RssA